MDSYVQWLKETNQPVYEMAGTYWRVYQKALVPACPKPEPIQLSLGQANKLLTQSRAVLLRYFTRTVRYPTPFWYTACAEYNFSHLPPKVRGSIRRGFKSCRVERVDPDWLADNGYPCYVAAFSRYRNSQPESRQKFDEMCRVSPDGPFEFWGVFVGDRLAGFAKSAVGSDYSATLVLKLDPNFMHLSTGPALQHTLLNAYVSEQGKPVYAGFRSIAHDTNTHDFLMKSGYSRVYCDLKVVYRPTLQAFINLLYMCRSVLNRFPESPTKRSIQALLTQEEIRRSAELERKHAIRSSLFERIARSVWGNRYGVREK
jgi:hypothetical protein